MRLEGFKGKPGHLRVLSNWSGMGDSIARLPALKYLVETYPHMTVEVFWQDYFQPLAEFLLPHTRIKHSKQSEMLYHGKGSLVTFDPDRVSSLGLNLVDQAFLILMDRLPPSAAYRFAKGQDACTGKANDPEASFRAPRFYPQAEIISWPGNIQSEIQNQLLDDPPFQSSIKKFVVFTSAYTSKTREWPAGEVNELAVQLAKRGYECVLLGSTKDQAVGNGHTIKGHLDDQIDRSLFLDLTNQTTLIEALGIMQRAACVVGVDNGLLHLAHCTSTPVVMGFTSVEALHRLPTRPKGQTKMITPKNCYGCQSKLNFVGFDFRNCIYGDYICTKEMTANNFLEAMEQLTK